MGDVNLGTVKAKLELDAQNLERTAAEAEAILKRLGASAEKQQEFLTALMKVPAENRSAFITPLQEAAAEFEKNSTLIGNLTNAYEQWSVKIADSGTAFKIASGAAAAFGVAVLGVAKQVADGIVANAEYVENLDKMAAKTGLSTSTLEGLGKAAKESGVSLSTVTAAVTKLEIAVANDSKALTDLGLSLRELKAASPEEMLAMVVPKLAEMSDV